MLFNSFQFALFFAAVFAVYACAGYRLQNALLLVVSYYFYASWDYRFPALLLLTTVVDYGVALAIFSLHLCGAATDLSGIEPRG